LPIAANELQRFAVGNSEAVHQAGYGVTASDALFAKEGGVLGLEQNGGRCWKSFEHRGRGNARAFGCWRNGKCCDHAEQRDTADGGCCPRVTKQSVDRWV